MTTTGERVGNWGRWGEEDERGALNLISGEAVLGAAHATTTGKVYPLGLPIQREGVPIFEYRGAPQRLTLTSHADPDMYAMYGGVVLLCSFDVRRFRPLIAGMGWLHVGLGAAKLAVDVAARMPAGWTVVEGPAVVLNGAAILWLLTRPPREVL